VTLVNADSITNGWFARTLQSRSLTTYHCWDLDCHDLALLSGIWHIVLYAQGSVWGSGSAGTLCAVAALAMGNATFWQVT